MFVSLPSDPVHVDACTVNVPSGGLQLLATVYAAACHLVARHGLLLLQFSHWACF